MEKTLLKGPHVVLHQGPVPQGACPAARGRWRAGQFVALLPQHEVFVGRLERLLVSVVAQRHDEDSVLGRNPRPNGALVRARSVSNDHLRARPQICRSGCAAVAVAHHHLRQVRRIVVRIVDGKAMPICSRYAQRHHSGVSTDTRCIWRVIGTILPTHHELRQVRRVVMRNVTERGIPIGVDLTQRFHSGVSAEQHGHRRVIGTIFSTHIGLHGIQRAHGVCLDCASRSANQTSARRGRQLVLS
eukprot:398634-Rhodomonas_salina.2